MISWPDILLQKNKALFLYYNMKEQGFLLRSSESESRTEKELSCPLSCDTNS